MAVCLQAASILMRQPRCTIRVSRLLSSANRPVRGQRRACAAPAASLRSLGRGTCEGQRPVDPSLRRRATRRRQAKESFDAELLVLFGVPVLVLVIAYAFNEPKSLAVVVPLVLLIPGSRDVLLYVAGDMWRGAAQARRFVSEEPVADIGGYESFQQQRRRWPQQQQQPGWRRRPPPPPPPVEVDCDSQRGEYDLDQSQQEEEEEEVEPGAPPLADSWSPTGSRSTTNSSELQQSSNSPSWRVVDGSGSSAQRRTYSRRGPVAGAMPHSQPPQGGPLVRGRQASRLVRPARKGRVGLELGRNEEKGRTPLLLRPLFALIPFLRWWGGFL